MKLLKRLRPEDIEAEHRQVLFWLYPKGKKNPTMQFRFDRRDWEALCAKTQAGSPAYIGSSGNKAGEEESFYYAYRGWCYQSEIRIPEEDIALIVDEEERAKNERVLSTIQKMKTRADSETLSRRPIPEDVQILVWNRDGGKCVRCGSKEKLEFDHIIPHLKGGSDTARNLELLCESCNRSKASHIGA